MTQAGATRIGASAERQDRGGRRAPDARRRSDASHAQSRRPFSRALRTAGLPAGSVGRHHADARPGPSCSPTWPRSSRGHPLRAVRHPALQRKAAGPAHPLRPGPPRGSGAQSVARRWARASPARPPPPREPVLVGDVRTDPRYLNAVDAVRTELAVPMMAAAEAGGRDRPAVHARSTPTPNTTARCCG